ncbi:hypothetical protein DAETH_38360 (plasmid) [Deinococcus aetherius]|uniref:DM13 domain-containing protein n=1 Tax=Deinococcus aetherius TaxID=200252 RepID=A0ABN6RQF1_9DEIO|nr:DM13 domain-containing protein [Deinococcus aetherius]BDP43867.1 hypothetical protein DAETH_38360 [Deinococcus aetherius]
MKNGQQPGPALLLALAVLGVAGAQSSVAPSGVIERTGVFRSWAAPTSGTVVAFRSREGATHLLLHRFQTGSCPRLQVWLHKGVPTRAQVEGGQGGSALQLGEMSLPRGSFEFALPPGVDMSAGFGSVVVWCAGSRAAFGMAPLE